jgi:serine/threonine-protein kinase HipA
MKKIIVTYAGWGERWTLGSLADNGQTILFEYAETALAQGLELSPRHLKLRTAAYDGFPTNQVRLPGLIADALPDGWGLLLMDRLFRKHGRRAGDISPLDRLAFIGERGMGALTFEPAEPWDKAQQDVSLLKLASEVHNLQIDGEDEAVLLELARLGGSPHGARPKVLVNFNPVSGRVSTRPFDGGEPWLVKFQASGEHKEVCALERAYADLARACGLDMPQAHYFDLSPKLAGFGVARFDREAGMRVPVHTLAGLLQADFRVPGSLDYTTFLRATRYLTQDVREVNKAYERAVFNVLFHNRDDHAKNVSFRLDADRRWRLAPCYDLTFSEGPGGEHQMDVCGEGRQVTRADLLTLAAQADLSPGWAATVIDRMLDQASQFVALASPFPIRKATLKAVSRAIDANAKRLASTGAHGQNRT